MATCYLVLVGPLDNPLSEHTFLSSRPSSLPSANNASSSSASNPSASSPAATYSSSFPSWVSSPYASFPNSTSSFGSNANSLIGIKEGSDAGKKKAGYDDGHLRQMVAHSSLDLIEDAMVGGNMYLKAVDKYNEWTVSAFVAPCVKMILLHETKNDEGIRLFFLDVWEAYVKTLLNPFHTPNTPIKSPLFEAKVRTSARRNL